MQSRGECDEGSDAYRSAPACDGDAPEARVYCTQQERLLDIILPDDGGEGQRARQPAWEGQGQGARQDEWAEGQANSRGSWTSIYACMGRAGRAEGAGHHKMPSMINLYKLLR